jgi:hypothetical protein
MMSNKAEEIQREREKGGEELSEEDITRIE